MQEKNLMQPDQSAREKFQEVFIITANGIEKNNSINSVRNPCATWGFRDSL